MSLSTEHVKLGACNVFFNGRDLGRTKGGVEVQVSTSTHEVTADQTGNTPIDELINGRTVTAKVPLLDTTLDNLVDIMPGAKLVTDGAYATGDVTFSDAPVAENKISIMGFDFVFKTKPKAEGEMGVPASAEAAAKALAGAINGVVVPVYAKVDGAKVELIADQRGAESNQPVVVVGANISANNLAGGAAVTKAKVSVPTGVNIKLSDFAGELMLRPIGTSGEDDFVIKKAACPGALNFTYNTDNERVYSADFKSYVANDGSLFEVGDTSVQS